MSDTTVDSIHWTGHSTPSAYARLTIQMSLLFTDLSQLLEQPKILAWLVHLYCRRPPPTCAISCKCGKVTEVPIRPPKPAVQKFFFFLQQGALLLMKDPLRWSNDYGVQSRPWQWNFDGDEIVEDRVLCDHCRLKNTRWSKCLEPSSTSVIIISCFWEVKPQILYSLNGRAHVWRCQKF